MAADPDEFKASNIGLDGAVARSSYFQRGTEQDAPTRIDGPVAKALVADSHALTNADGIRMISHEGGLNVLYTDDSVVFLAVPDSLCLESGNSSAWQTLDE